ncbi:uncharacterized protein LOC143462448 [Clavelina lepadiformis]
MNGLQIGGLVLLLAFQAHALNCFVCNVITVDGAITTDECTNVTAPVLCGFGETFCETFTQSSTFVGSPYVTETRKCSSRSGNGECVENQGTQECLTTCTTDGCNDPRPKTFPQSGPENQNGPFGNRVGGEGGGDGGDGGGADSTARIHLISVVFTTLSSVAFILF